MSAKKSFAFYAEWAEVLAGYPDNIRLEVYDATIRYAVFGEIVELCPFAQMAFNFIRKDIDHANEEAEKLSATLSSAGRKGAAARWGSVPKNASCDAPISSDSNNGQAIEAMANNGQAIEAMANDGQAIEAMANDSLSIVEAPEYLGVIEKEKAVVEQDADEDPDFASRVRSDNIYKLNNINNITPTREIKENQDINILNKRKEREAPSFGSEAEVLAPLSCEKKFEKQPPRCETLVAESGNRVDYARVVEMYHTTCKSFPRIRGLTEQRKAKVKQRLSEMGGSLDTLAEVFRKMEASDFMKSGGWASFDWVFANSQNWMKILEGNYDNDRHNNKRNGKFNAGLDPRFNFRSADKEINAERYPDVL